MSKERCTSCQMELANLAGSTHFKCPSCGKTEIIRCAHCRMIASKYTCTSCNFVGPN